MVSSWDKTGQCIRRMEGKITYLNGVPYYNAGTPRRVIGRDSLVDGGIYLGAGERESIVVDSGRESGKLLEVYRKILNASTLGGRVNNGLILDAAYSVIDESFPLKGEEYVDQILRKYDIDPNNPKDAKIDLDIFVNEGVGSCRHLSLVNTFALQQAKKDGHIKGQARINRNQTPLGGHAWTRYTNRDGDVFISDIALGLGVRSLREAQESGKWDYAKPEDSIAA